MTIRQGLDYSKLPIHMQEGIQAYIEQGRPPDRFLYAVLSNDLVHSYCHADSENAAAMPKWASFLYNEAPIDSWGSKKAVDAWIKQGGYVK